MSHFVAAVIPAYRAPQSLVDRVAALTEQVDLVVVVDDGSDSLSVLSFPPNGVVTLSLDENHGIGHALNRGIAIARSAGATHVLTLDQDSAPAEGYVAEAIRVLVTSEAAGERIAAVVPEFIATQRILIRDGFAFDPIQAGQLLPMEVIDDIGGFREELFIDAVDSEFTVRAEEAGYRFAVAPGTRLAHELGDLVPLTLFGRPVVLGGKPRHVLYHSPFRTYYMVRNSVILGREHWRSRPGWMSVRTRKMTEMVIGCILLAPDRGAQWRASVAGVKDGLAGVTGRITDARLRRIAGRRRDS